MDALRERESESNRVGTSPETQSCTFHKTESVEAVKTNPPVHPSLTAGGARARLCAPSLRRFDFSWNV